MTGTGTGFNYQPPSASGGTNSLMNGVMMASSYPMRQQPLQSANS